MLDPIKKPRLCKSVESLNLRHYFQKFYLKIAFGKQLNSDLAAGTARKANITLFKEDWIELVARLQNLLDDIVRDSPTLSWAKNIKLNHQLCSQKYRNLKKVYILSKQSDRKKFAYKVRKINFYLSKSVFYFRTHLKKSRN